MIQRFIITAFALAIFANSFAQKPKDEDTKIIVTMSDSLELYKKVKIALVNNDFIVKDNYNYDTLTTYAREMHNFPGFVISKAIISGNKVIISGTYGLKRIDSFDYTLNPVTYTQIQYYKGSYSWKLLNAVASQIGGQINYGK
jgi:hypothetical protein